MTANRHHQVVMRGALLILLLMTMARDVAAQGRTLLGFSAAAYGDAPPYPSPAGLGVHVGFEQEAGGVRLAAVASVLKTVRTSDHIAVCYIGPDDGCLEPALFPLWLSAAELEASVAPIRVLPLRLVGSAGISHGFDARAYWKGAPRTPNDAETQLMFRGGLELVLGSARHSPRVRYTRTSFGAKPFGLTSLKSLTLVIVR